MLNPENIKEIFNYNPETGDLTWRQRIGGRTLGKIGTLDKDGYLIFLMNYRKNRYCVHRVIWAYVHGKWPKDQIDHINGIKNDNRLCNLRQANTAENMRNVGRQSHNTSGIKGVSWHKLRGKWRADIKVNQKQIWLGNFDCSAAASFAYQIAADKYHGKFARSF
jgi:hypothetical protein